MAVGLIATIATAKTPRPTSLRRRITPTVILPSPTSRIRGAKNYFRDRKSLIFREGSGKNSEKRL